MGAGADLSGQRRRHERGALLAIGAALLGDTDVQVVEQRRHARCGDAGLLAAHTPARAPLGSWVAAAAVRRAVAELAICPALAGVRAAAERLSEVVDADAARSADVCLAAAAAVRAVASERPRRSAVQRRAEGRRANER